MTSVNKTVVVLGATGQQGGSVAAALRADGWAVRAVVRDPSGHRARSLSAIGVETFRGDLGDSPITDSQSATARSRSAAPPASPPPAAPVSLLSSSPAARLPRTRGGVRVVRAEDAFRVGEDRLPGRDGPFALPALRQGVGQVVAYEKCARVLGAEDQLGLGQCPLVQSDGPLQARSAGLLQGACQVVARGEGVGVVGTQQALTAGQGTFAEGGGLRDVSRWWSARTRRRRTGRRWAGGAVPWSASLMRSACRCLGTVVSTYLFFRWSRRA